MHESDGYFEILLMPNGGEEEVNALFMIAISLAALRETLLSLIMLWWLERCCSIPPMHLGVTVPLGVNERFSSRVIISFVPAIRISLYSLGFSRQIWQMKKSLWTGQWKLGLIADKTVLGTPQVIFELLRVLTNPMSLL
jgi:hypothetical protein